MGSRLFLPGGRSLALSSLKDALPAGLSAPFATLVPAFDLGELRDVEAIARTLLDLGCSEFCCVGPEAESLHDALDIIIEERGSFDVVTTWHTDETDACEYFLFGAGGGLPSLLAMTQVHPALTSLLERMVLDDN